MSPSRDHRYKFAADPVAKETNVFKGDKYRLTLMTESVLRYEWDDENKFEDRASTFALFRNLPPVEHTLTETDDSLTITTRTLVIFLNKKECKNGFTAAGFNVAGKMFASGGGKWFYGGGESSGLSQARFNLKGTARTLDEANGRVELESGVCSHTGTAEINDSDSQVFDETGWMITRSKPAGKREDVYLFAHGDNFKQAVLDFYKISGKQGLLPRWSFGTWWSRYYAYHAQEYLDLMDRFAEEKIPLAVGVLDMDWHYVNIDREKYGAGWTGYTWNTDLFPDPPAFLKELHDRKLKTTLNLHPADGVRAHEKPYEAICKALGRDSKTGEPVPFDPSNREFMDAYFEYLHHPLEEEGVDFWWMDYQQHDDRGTKLWALNHYHYLDSARRGDRPMGFSRYAGPGSHRYPVGFSGDTFITWASLQFQPEFTVTASNVGYGHWSNDIGGHFFGGKDDELFARWVQLGLWSPILRLHSTQNPFNNKEPWGFSADARSAATAALQFRHRLIPYLYSVNYASATGGLPLMRPMYWEFGGQGEDQCPRDFFHYKYNNQYFFGATEVLILPVVGKRDEATGMSKVEGWLPKGVWVDLDTGIRYDGNRELVIYRALDKYGVFLQEGAVLPLATGKAANENGAENPDELEVVLVVGKSARFEVIEDDGTGGVVEDVKIRKAVITYSHEDGTLKIDDQLEPDGKRKWTVKLLGVSDADAIKGVKQADGGSIAVKKVAGGLLLTPSSGTTSSSPSLVVQLPPALQLSVIDPKPMLWTIIDQAQCEYELKRSLWHALDIKGLPLNARLSRVIALTHNADEKRTVGEAVMELMLADSRWKGE